MAVRQLEQTTIRTALVQTKLVAPRPRSNLVPRPRLHEQLNTHLDCKLTLLSAPAGFGKTTLASAWAAQHRANQTNLAFGWLSLDTGDNDPIRFWRYLLAACESFAPDIRAVTSDILLALMQPSYKAALTMVINTLAQLPRKHILILEDYHVITAALIHQQLEFLLEYLPASLRIILITRSDPPLPLAKLRANHDLHELRVEQLRFSLSETQAFLDHSLPYAFPPEEVVRLDARTEGWAAGLQLIALTLPMQRDQAAIGRVLDTISGSHRHIVTYFLSEVLATQPELVQRFLLQTSGLQRLSAALCDAVTGQSDGAAMLHQLERTNVFVFPLDETGTWYRYHPLFAEAMHDEAYARLGADAMRRCFDQASEWYEAHGLASEAIEAALQANAFTRAARLIEQRIQQQHFQDIIEYDTFHRWMSALPESILQQYPRLCLRFAVIVLFSAARRSPNAQAHMQRSLDAAEQYWQAAGDSAQIAAIQTVRALIAEDQGDLDRAIRYAREAIPQLSASEQNWRGACLRIIATEQLHAGQVRVAQETLLQARALFEGIGNRYAARLTRLRLADVNYSQGQLHQAAELYRDVAAHAGVDIVDRGHALLGLARLAYEWNMFGSAEQAAHEACEIGARLSDEQVQVGAALLFARIEHARGRTTHAQQRLYRLITQTTYPLLLAAIEALQAHIAVDIGHIAIVERWRTARERRLDALPRAQHEQEDYVIARFHIACGEIDAARRLLVRCQVDAHAAGRLRSELEARTLLALSYAYDQDLSHAQQLLVETLILAQSEGYIRLFIDEGERLGQLLRSIVSEAGEDSVVRYARSLLHGAVDSTILTDDDAFPTTTALIVPLSPQEQRVLQLLAAGHSNPDMAQTLVVSINTIKTHVKSIYRKLNVTNRVEACMTARNLQLL
jgi:LuxR family maltose regulon positive regulatory protein